MPTPNVYGGFQPDTKDPSSRRADFDLLRRAADMERRVVELERVVAILGSEVSVSSYASFSFNAATTEPPIGNQVRLNNASQTAATRLWVSHTTFDNLDVTIGVSRIKAGNKIYFQDFDDATKWVRYTVVSATNDGAYHDFVVTYDVGPGTVPFQKVALQFISLGAIT